MSGKKQGLVAKGWKASVETRGGRCDADVMRGGTQEQCLRSGNCGWGDQRFCYQHHPDWEAWLDELRYFQRIAQNAVTAAEAQCRLRSAGVAPQAEARAVTQGAK